MTAPVPDYGFMYGIPVSFIIIIIIICIVIHY